MRTYATGIQEQVVGRDLTMLPPCRTPWVGMEARVDGVG